MIETPLERVAELVGGVLVDCPTDATVVRTVVDSRRCQPKDLFFALAGSHTDGHQYVAEAQRAGAIAVVVKTHLKPGPSILVSDPLAALQALAKWYRQVHINTVIAITGSNGKTIVKDALMSLLAGQRGVYASPGSHNSQLGVPLAVLNAPPHTQVGIFEAGISAPGEMSLLEDILKPDHGVLTNIGLAHIAGFGSRSNTAKEKLCLFKDTQGWVVLPDEEPLVAEPSIPGRIVRSHTSGAVRLSQCVVHREGAQIDVAFPDGRSHSVALGVSAPPLIDDLLLAMTAAHLMGVDPQTIAFNATGFSPGPTRLEVWTTPDGVTIINDAHSADPMSVQAALRSAAAFGNRCVFAFGGMTGLGSHEATEHALIGRLAGDQQVAHLVLIDTPALHHTATAYTQAYPKGKISWVNQAAEIRDTVRPIAQEGDVILVKGPRNQNLSVAALSLWESMATKRLIVDLDAITENVSRISRIVGGHVCILATLKAWAYGTDLARMASHLQTHGVHWIGVSAADEGAMLRRSGVHLPILVLLLDAAEVDKVIRYALTPVVYSKPLAEALIEAANRANTTIDVHLQVDTGMGRLGVQPNELLALCQQVADSGVLCPTGVMTHLSCADDPNADDYSNQQLDTFDAAIAQLNEAGFTDLICHASASAGAVRFARARYNMVRIGLALYGVHSSPTMAQTLELQPAVALMGRVAHVTVFVKGQKVGYAATHTVLTDTMRVGVVAMGYNDGIPWRLSGCGYALIQGRRANFVGRVSMDSLVVDLSDHPNVDVGEDVLFFGSHEGATLRPETVAELAGTIPYELLVNIDTQRVQRLFVGE